MMPATNTGRRGRRVRSTGDLSLMPLYVPSRTGEGLGILPGSAIVGHWTFEVGRVRLDIEGNKYNFDGMRRYVERAMHAWDRYVQHYPTMARVWARSHEVVMVGEYDPLNKRVILNDLDRPRLEAWLGMSPIPDDELVL